MDKATVHSDASDAMPFSAFSSGEAEHAFRTALSPAPANLKDDPLGLRSHYDAFNAGLLARMEHAFRVGISQDVVAGVPVQWVVPLGADRTGRLLVNLHGGAFMWGSGAGALVEAIPVAAATGLPVLAVDYRLAPEHRHPAAAEDAAAVHAELLMNHAPASLGLFGCSAGAVLAAQTMALLQSRGIPLPGAAAMLFGAGLDMLGDSAFLSPELLGEDASAAKERPALVLSALPYLKDCDPGDAAVFPGLSSEILAHFPPTFLATGSRDFAASSTTTMHRRLRAAGRDAELMMFDGMWHAFHIFHDLPESRELFRALAGFFQKNLTATSLSGRTSWMENPDDIEKTGISVIDIDEG